MNKTPNKSEKFNNSMELLTPPSQISFSQELRKVLHEKNLLTAKTRNKVCEMLDNSKYQEINDDTKKLQSLRHQAVEEILMSEKSYIKQLSTLMTYFVNPLKAIIDQQTHILLFGQIEMIFNLNTELLNELETNLDNVAGAFLKLAPFFKLYSVYAFDYKQSLITLQNLSTKNDNFKRFLYKTETRPEVQTKLNSLLITPIQRVPRYRLLLQQVLLYTKPSNIDYKIIQDSIKQIENTASHIDSVIEDQENIQILINLQNSLTNQKPLIVKPSRKVIKEGVLTRISSNGLNYKRYCVLMSDIFMYCKIIKDRAPQSLLENSIKCSCIFPLKKCKVSEIFPGNFKISCHGDGIIFSTSEISSGKEWVRKLKETIDSHIECRKTLRKESSKRKPIRNKNDFNNFENETKKLNPYDYETVQRYNNGTNSDSDDGDDDEYSSPEFKCFNMKSRKRKITETAAPNSALNLLRSPILKDLPSNNEMCLPLRDQNRVSNNDQPIVPKKRVKFELSETKYNDDGYCFPNDFQTYATIQPTRPSIRDRISKFFSGLF